jgi:hypothetical protein
MIKGKRYAVLIGSSKYPQDERLLALRCPEKDVDELELVLKSEDYGYFNEIIVLKDSPFHVCNRKILQVLKLAKQDDLVLIYYSGHGKLDMEGSLYLATVDTQIDDLEATSIPAENIRKYVRFSPSRKVILVLDCCYSGRVGDSFLKGGVEDQLQQFQSGRGIYILTASTGLQVAQERQEDENSLLTKYILEGIKEGKADADDKGFTSIDDLYRYSVGQMRKDGFQVPMKWELDVQGDELVIARTGKTPGEKRREQTQQVLFDFLHNEKLPWEIVKKAVEILDSGKSHLSEAQAEYDTLLDELVQKRVKIMEFVFRWQAIDRKIEDELKRKQKSTLYHKAQNARRERDWVLVIDTLQQLLVLDSTYADASDIFEDAQKQLEISNLYATGRKHLIAGHWPEALSALTQIQSEFTNYEDVAGLIERAETRLKKEKEDILDLGELEPAQSEAASVFELDLD